MSGNSAMGIGVVNPKISFDLQSIKRVTFAWKYGVVIHNIYITLMKSKTNDTGNENLRIYTTSRFISLPWAFAKG